MEQEKQVILDKWIKSHALNKVPKVVPPKLLSDKEFVIEVFKNIPLNFPLLYELPAKLKKDKDVIKEAVKAFPYNITFVPSETLNDKEFVLFLAPFATKNLTHKSYYFSPSNFVKKIPQKILKDHEVRVTYLSLDPTLLSDFYQKDSRIFLCDNREIAMLVVSKWGFGIHLLSKELRDDKEIVLTAIEHDDYFKGSSLQRYVCEQSYLQYASERLRDDKDVVLLAAQHFGLGLIYASDRLKDDKEIALAAVSHPNEKGQYDVEEKGCHVECSYNFVSARLKADREVALLAVQNNPWAYYFAPLEIKQDFEIAKIAINNFVNPGLLKAPKELFDNKDFLLETIGSGTIKYASYRLKNDKDVALAAVKHAPSYYQHLSFEMQKDPDIILLATRDGLHGLYPMTREVIKRNDKYILRVIFKAEDIIRAANIIKAVSGFGTTRDQQKEINAVADELAAHANFEDTVVEVEIDEDFIISRIKRADIFMFPQDILDNAELMLKIINVNHDMIDEASDRLKDDKYFMSKAVEIYYYSVRYASARLKDDDEFMNKVVDKWNALIEIEVVRVHVLEFASDRLKDNEEFVSRIRPQKGVPAYKYASKRVQELLANKQ